MFSVTNQEIKLARKIQRYKYAPNTVTETVYLERDEATAQNISALANRFEGTDQLKAIKRLELRNVSFSVENTNALV